MPEAYTIVLLEKEKVYKNLKKKSGSFTAHTPLQKQMGIQVIRYTTGGGYMSERYA